MRQLPVSKPAKPVRLTQQLNLALAKASAAVAIGKANPEHAQKGCALAYEAVTEAQAIMGEIVRAAEAI